MSTLQLGRAFKWFFSRGGHLKDQVFRGSIWLVLGDIATRAASILKLAILARLLSPHDFGLMGIAMVFLRGVEHFTETGFSAGLIQKSGDIRPYLNTAWTAQIVRSGAVAIILFFIAPLGAKFFANAQATPVIRAVGLVTLIYGFLNPAVIFLRKELDFRRDVYWKLSGVLAGLLVAILMVFWYRNVWVLVTSVVASAAGSTIASYWIVPYKPRLQFDWQRARELYRFGKWIFWGSMAGYFALYADSVAAGKVLGTTALGFYQVASQLGLLPAAQISRHVSGMMFPTFSKLQDSPDVKRIFFKSLAALTWVIVPAACFLSVFAKPIVLLVLGLHWVSVSPVVRILAWAGVAVGFRGLANPLFMGLGKPKIAVKATLVKLLVLATSLYPLAKIHGITGVAISLALSDSVAMGYQYVLVVRMLRPTCGELVGSLRAGILGSVPFLAAGLLPLSGHLLLQVGAGSLAVIVYLSLFLPALRAYFRGHEQSISKVPAPVGRIKTTHSGSE